MSISISVSIYGYVFSLPAERGRAGKHVGWRHFRVEAVISISTSIDLSISLSLYLYLYLYMDMYSRYLRNEAAPASTSAGVTFE